MAMDARKQRILEAIVALYANDGEPVGSGLLANYFDMALSSATLRNEMAALTKLCLLEQPHTRLSHSVRYSRSGTRRSTFTPSAGKYSSRCVPSMLTQTALPPLWTSLP